MVSFNKKATVAVVPELKLNQNTNVPLSLLDDKMKLKVEIMTTAGVKNISTCEKSTTSSNDAILFDFMVPDQRKSLLFCIRHHTNIKYS